MDSISTERMRTIGGLLAPEVSELLDQQPRSEAREALIALMDPEIADVLMELSPEKRILGFRLLPRDRAADVFTYLSPEHQEHLFDELNSEYLAHVFEEMSPDDRVELFDEMPGQLAAKLLGLMHPEERRRTQVILGYPPESVGRIMTPDYLTLRPEWTVQQALEHIRRQGSEAETLNTLYVVDERGGLIDDVPLRQLVLSDPERTVESLMDLQVVSLNARSDQEEAVRVMNRYDRAALPVVDSTGVLVGIVTFDDVADVAQEEVTEDMQKMGGVAALDESYMSASIWHLFRKRGLWLSVLFVGELLTASVMGLFHDELAHVLALVLFVPLITSSGGNSGSQASTLVIRAMALGELNLRDWARVFRRELLCGAMLGLWLGVIGLARVVFWQWMGWFNFTAYYVKVGLTLSVALVGVVVWGTLAGSMLPFALRRLRLDPATISSPLVATLVDVAGLLIYFTAAALLLRGTLL